MDVSSRRTSPKSDIPVDDGLSVGVIDGRGECREKARNRAHWKLIPSFVQRFEIASKGGTFHQFHDEAGLTFHQVVIIHLNDVGVPQACHHARFAFEAHPCFRVPIHVVAHDFYRYFAIKRDVLTHIYFGHAAASDHLSDFYMIDGLTGP